MTRVLVVAPHPDDEALGCGGALLRHRSQGDETHWLIVTAMTPELGYSPARIAARQREIERAAAHFGFAGVHALRFPAARLDTLPLADVIEKIAAVFRRVEPETLYLPFAGDAHSDHRVVFDACAACTKGFRYPSIRRIRVYETLSETELGLVPAATGFHPNLFIDISEHLDGKVSAMRIYENEMGDFPFPRSEEAIRGLAAFRGAAAGCRAAESFMTLKEIL